jgi:hypothetical protein
MNFGRTYVAVSLVGERDGSAVGVTVWGPHRPNPSQKILGLGVGCFVGDNVGSEGEDDGIEVGLALGMPLGCELGLAVGATSSARNRR